jgi:hypothetical protein
MTGGDPTRASDTLAVIRRVLLGALTLGIVGTGSELILLGHVDEPAQWIPLVALGVSMPVLLWHVVAPRRVSVRFVQVLMATFLLTGVLGVGLHTKGNVEFERELHPTERGAEFLRKTLAGATPVLAPGSMVLLGLIGLAFTYRDPHVSDPSGLEK